jgi:hypothetical protein
VRFTIYDIRFTRGLSFSKRVASCGLLLAALSCLNADAQDTELEHQIIGTWARDKSSEMIINTNGSFHSKFSTAYSSVTKTWNYYGTWQIKDGFCVMTITNASTTGATNFEAVGSIGRAKIIKLEGTSLVWKLDDQTIAFRRK